MAINKVDFGGRTLMDLTGDTVTPSTLLQGVTAHNAAGEQITGEMPQSGGSAVSDVLWVTGDLNLLNYQVANLSHSFAQIQSAYQSDKVVKLKIGYGTSADWSAATILDLQTADYYEGDATDIIFSGLMVADFGTGEEVYLIRILIYPNDQTFFEFRLLNSMQIV